MPGPHNIWTPGNELVSGLVDNIKVRLLSPEQKFSEGDFDMDSNPVYGKISMINDMLEWCHMDKCRITVMWYALIRNCWKYLPKNMAMLCLPFKWGGMGIFPTDMSIQPDYIKDLIIVKENKDYSQQGIFDS